MYGTKPKQFLQCRIALIQDLRGLCAGAESGDQRDLPKIITISDLIMPQEHQTPFNRVDPGTIRHPVQHPHQVRRGGVLHFPQVHEDHL